jgi:signal peptidase I
VTVAAPPARRAARRLVLLVVAALLLVTVRMFVAEPLRVDGDSMAPTLRSGDVALLRKFGTPHVGQVVVLTDPQDGGPVVKRVVALGGQTVEIRDAYLYVDGAEVDEPFVDHSRIDGVYFGPVTVPAGDVFVLGDSRNGSIDSRIFGAVPASAVTGRVLVRLWPPVR